MKHTYIIPRKESGTGNSHDIASDQFDRPIVFGPGCKYAVVQAAWYGGNRYHTHKTEAAAIKASRQMRHDSHAIIDTEGNRYTFDAYDPRAKLVRVD